MSTCPTQFLLNMSDSLTFGITDLDQLISGNRFHEKSTPNESSSTLIQNPYVSILYNCNKLLSYNGMEPSQSLSASSSLLSINVFFHSIVVITVQILLKLHHQVPFYNRKSQLDFGGCDLNHLGIRGQRARNRHFHVVH